MRMPRARAFFRGFRFWIAATLVALSASVAATDTTIASKSSSPARATHTNDLPIVIEARELLETIEQLRVEYVELKAENESAQDADGKAVAELQARRRIVDRMRAIEALVANVLEQQERGLDESGFLQETRKLLWALDRRLPSFIDEVSSENAELRGTLAEASPESMTGIQARIRGNEETLDEVVRFYVSHIEHMDQLELGSARARANAAEALERRAGNLAARLELVSQKVDAAEELEGSAAEQGLASRRTQEDLDRIAASLWTVCDALDELGLPTAAHRRALILATGELTTDVLDREVAAELANAAIEMMQVWFEQRGPVLVGRLVDFWACWRSFGFSAARRAV